MATAVAWRLEFEVERALPLDATTASLEELRLRKEELLVRLRELEVGRAEGQLVTLDDHREVVQKIASSVRTSIMGIPGHWAPQIVGIADLVQASEAARALSERLLGDLREDVLSFLQEGPAR